MTDKPLRILALVPVDPAVGPLGLAAGHDETLGGRTILHWTLERLGSVQGLDGIVLIAPEGYEPSLPDAPSIQKMLKVHHVPGSIWDRDRPRRLAARKWAAACWRGGLGGATIWDELISPKVMAELLEAQDAAAGLLCGPDWPLMDGELASAMIERYREHGGQMKFIFSQAVPGLGACVVDRGLLEEFGLKRAMIGSLLDYQPSLPQSDPIGKEMCLPISPKVRDADMRLTFDAARWRRGLRELSRRADLSRLSGAEAVTELMAIARRAPEGAPRQVALELTARRQAQGPAAVQHHLAIRRDDLSLDQAREWFEQFAEVDDLALTLGGLGDPLLHESWPRMIELARESGVWGLHVKTDLICEPEEARRLARSGVEAVSIQLNANTAETYRSLMGVDGFEKALGNIQTLLMHARGTEDSPGGGLPWVLPRMVKLRGNLHEMEAFFDRWSHYCGHALLEGPTTGCGLIEDQSVVPMAPPRRGICRQVMQRMTILSDGRPALCDQDWLGGGHPMSPIVDAPNAPGGAATLTLPILKEAWEAVEPIREAHLNGESASLPMCGKCDAWHRG